ncbi:uncharacterized protein LOC119791667 isoform X2 [Cyprinodon tularosa]|uniref:uncharacterized protein LOC119791667 isoform X2 n=1 Tax=Cyprinodon tularosa TaxID=77115 RepID=UPI0018E22BB8|nr:uncharacterized protein LOC119791667 isoform X2 [Cyprinodon tularosa]
MEVFETLGLKIPNTVLIDGVPENPTDELIAFLEQYGDIKQRLTIDSSESEFDQMLVVEFDSGLSLARLSPILPYTFTSSVGDKFHIESLSEIYASKVGGLKTNKYLDDLQEIAKLSGKNYTQVLTEVMSQIQQSIAEFCPVVLKKAKEEQFADEDGGQQPSAHATTQLPFPLSSLSQSVPLPSSSAVSNRAEVPSQERRSTPISAGDLNPPEVQRYVVEHVVRSGDSSLHMHTSHRLRAFSGKVPRPSHETDYDTWRSSVELVLQDPSMSQLQCTRIIRDSLLPPACDIVKHLSPDTLPKVYLEQLDSAYGTVQDGEELYVKFMDTYQDSGEKPSAYLQRLQVVLQSAVKRGGDLEKDMDARLLTQFCRGCWDNNLISELQLKQRKNNPPSFAELLLLLRTEEDREAAKTLRMKHHLGTTKQKVASQVQFAHTDQETNLCVALNNMTKQLSQQMAAIQQQLTALTAGQMGTKLPFAGRVTSKPIVKKTVKDVKFGMSSSKPGFCFRCGEDGHIKPRCDNEPNSALVSAKWKIFYDKQKRQGQNPSPTAHLN